MKPYLLLFTSLLLVACETEHSPQSGSHIHQAAGKSNYVTKLEQMDKVDAGNGEIIYQMQGKDYNFQSLSFAITETHPGGGPPLHTHKSEEAHVLLEGKMTYLIGDSIFSVEGPFVAHVPAGTPHTFINSGDSILNLIAVFPRDSFGAYNPIGKNPLIK